MRALGARCAAFLAAAVVAAIILAIPLHQAWADPSPEPGDQTSLSDDYIAQAIASGELQFEFERLTEDAPGSLEELESLQLLDSSNEVVAIAGANRYETSANQALDGWTSAPIVIIASGTSWPDALAASGLAGALDAPILLVSPTQIDASVAEALGTLGTERAIVVGGVNAVGEEVVTQLGELSIKIVDRLSGSNRFETQLAIYQYGLDKGYWSADGVIVASGHPDAFADVLSASAAAFARKMPVFLADYNGALSVGQQDALAASASAGTLGQPVVIGGTARITDRTVGFLDVLSRMSAASGADAVRIAGENRYETSAEVANWAVGKGWLSVQGAAFSSATTPYDALGGGALQGKQGSVLLLVAGKVTNYATQVVVDNGNTTVARFFGGTAALSEKTRRYVQVGLGFIPLQGLLKVYIDAGHGWNSSNNNVYDYGASGSGYREADLTQELSRKVATYLTDTYGISVHLNDYGGWYKLRQAEAKSLGCDVLVSIHFNACGATGSESFIHSYNAAAGSDVLQDYVHAGLIRGMGLTDRGQKQAELAVCGGSLPAVLLEICFIDNESDMAAYNVRKDIVAQEIARGIYDWAMANPDVYI